MDPSNKNEWLAAKQELKALLDVAQTAEDDMREAYANLAPDAWVHHCTENVVHSGEYAHMDAVKAAEWLSTTFAVARLVQERFQRRFDLVVCASAPVWMYFDDRGEQQAVTVDSHYFTTPDHSPEAIADALATLVRMEAKDDHDTLFVYSLVKRADVALPKFLVKMAESEVRLPRYQTRFATARRKV